MPSNKSVHFSNKMEMLIFFDDEKDSIDAKRGEDSCCCCVTPSRTCLMWEKVRKESLELKSKGIGILVRDSFHSPAQVAQEQINTFVQLPPEVCGRGLEKYLSRQHEEERLFAKETARATVLTGQKTMKQQGHSPEKIAARLSARLRECSLAAKVFARRMAIADELAARLDEVGTDMAQNIVKELLSGNAKKVCRKPSLHDSFSSDKSNSSCSLSSLGEGMPSKIPVSPPISLMHGVNQNSSPTIAEEFSSQYQCYEQVPVQQKSSVARTA